MHFSKRVREICKLSKMFYPLEYFRILLIFQLIVLCLTVEYDQLPPDENLLEQNIFYEGLYNRLQANDFGFAKFGEPCDDLSVEELENFLELANLIIKDQEEDGAYRRTVEEHLRPKLKYLYDRFKLHCDYRQFQVCHKRHKTCVCPHSSMGPGRSETCGFNLGKRCDLSQDRMIALGVLMPWSQKANVSCLGRAECVSSFGAAKRLCRCPKGYHASNCKHSTDSSGGKDGLISRGQMGRGFSSNDSKLSIDKSLWDTDDLEMILFPNEIKRNLVELMDMRNMFSKADREKEAESLYSKMVSDAEKEDMVIKDIFIRRNAILIYGQTCDPSQQVKLDHPPLATEGNAWIDPKVIDVQNWQKSLLDGQQPMCSYLNYLQCDSTQGICVCKDGLEYITDEKEGCRLKVGQSCSHDYISSFEFDPLRDLKRFSLPYPPACGPDSSCQLRPLIFTKQCWCVPSGNNTHCKNDYEDRYNKIVEQIGERFTLELGNQCDPKMHENLFNPQDRARSDFATRVVQLEQLVGMSGLRFCSLESFLQCNETSKKCECFDELLEQDGKCNIKHMDNCGVPYTIGRDFYPPKGDLAGMKMWKIEQVFEKKLSPLCVKNAVCSDETSKCTCTNGLAGSACGDPRSVFAQVLSPFKIEGYNEDRKINPILHELNLYTSRIEDLMTLIHGETCNTNFGDRLERIVRFFRIIGNSDEKISGSQSLYQYDKARLWAMELALLASKPPENTADSVSVFLCNAYLGFTCHHTGKCRCINGTSFENNECKLSLGVGCDKSPIAGWMQSCRNNSECVAEDDTKQPVCRCSKGWSGELCQDKEEEEVQASESPNPVAPTEESIVSFEEIDEMINEIMYHRKLGLGERCNVENESQLSAYFPTLPQWNQDVFEKLPNGRKKTYYTLRKIFNAGQEFCSRKEYLACNSSTDKCECGSQYGLVREDNDCRLKEYSYCGEINTIYDHDFPIPLCMKGHKCTKMDFGMYKCIKIPNSRERD